MKITEITTHRIRISADQWFHPHPIPVGHVPFWENGFGCHHEITRRIRRKNPF